MVEERRGEGERRRKGKAEEGKRTYERNDFPDCVCVPAIIPIYLYLWLQLQVWLEYCTEVSPFTVDNCTGIYL